MASIASQATVWSPGTGYYLYDGGDPASTSPGPLFPVMLPTGLAGSGGTGGGGPYPYTSNADPRTPSNGTISIQNVGDFDSLVPSSILNRNWQNICSGVAPATGSISVGAPAVGNLYSDAVGTNPRGLSEEIALGARFSIPPGATSVNLNVNMSDGGTNGTVAIGFSSTAPNCGIPSTSAIVTPAATMTTYSKSVSVSPPGLQVAEIIMGVSAWGTTGIGSPVIGTVQVQPVGASGIFASDFWRVGASGTNMWYNDRDEFFYYDFAFKHSPGAELVFDTDATQIATEQEWDNSASPDKYQSGVIYVNGHPYAVIPTTGSGSTYYGQFLTFTLPTGMKRVEIESGGYTATGGGFGATDNRRGNSLQAVYFPVASTTYLVPPPSPSGRVLEVYGDSIAQGFYAPYTLEQSWTQLLRRWFPGQVFFELWSARALYYDIGESPGPLGFNAASLQQLVNTMAAPRPTDIWLQMGANDYLEAFWNAASFGTAYAALLDALHQRIPGANIYLQTLTITQDEAVANGAGSTPPNYRTAETNACSARSWCTLVDGTTMFSSGCLQDSVHPVADCETTYALKALAALEPVNGAAGSAPTAWNSSPPNVGNCTLSSGTCNAVVAAATGSSNCYCGIQGTYARDAGAVTCSAQADAGSATCYCYYATLIADPAPAPVGIHCDN